MTSILQGHYQLEDRFLLKMEIRQGAHVIYEDMALNDIVLHAGKSVHMLDFHLKLMGLMSIVSTVMVRLPPHRRVRPLMRYQVAGPDYSS